MKGDLGRIRSPSRLWTSGTLAALSGDKYRPHSTWSFFGRRDSALVSSVNNLEDLSGNALVPDSATVGRRRGVSYVRVVKPRLRTPDDAHLASTMVWTAPSCSRKIIPGPSVGCR